jgi:hypothetical protein
VLGWLRDPHDACSGLLFLPFARPAHARMTVTGVQRVRTRAVGRDPGHMRTERANGPPARPRGG